MEFLSSFVPPTVGDILTDHVLTLFIRARGGLVIGRFGSISERPVCYSPNRPVVETCFHPIKRPQVAQSGTSEWVNLKFGILRGDTSGPFQLELILVSIEM